MAFLKAALVITGSEIITGRRVDALVQPFAAQLTANGITVAEVRMISDAPDMLCSTILDLIDIADFIIVTGGLGLTPDDTTRLAIATLKNRLSPSVEARIKNPVGSAEGIDLRFKTCRVVFLPGVPRESHAMFPLVLDGIGGEIPATIEIPVFGLREVEIAVRIGSLAEKCGYLPREMEIALVAPAQLETQIRSILGRHALEGNGLARTFGELLKTRGLTCAAAESCTGGLISHLITQVPGSSEYFLGSSRVLQQRGQGKRSQGQPERYRPIWRGERAGSQGHAQRGAQAYRGGCGHGHHRHCGSGRRLATKSPWAPCGSA